MIVVPLSKFLWLWFRLLFDNNKLLNDGIVFIVPVLLILNCLDLSLQFILDEFFLSNSVLEILQRSIKASTVVGIETIFRTKIVRFFFWILNWSIEVVSVFGKRNLVFFHFFRIWVNVDLLDLWCFFLFITFFFFFLRFNFFSGSATDIPSKIQYEWFHKNEY